MNNINDITTVKYSEMINNEQDSLDSRDLCCSCSQVTRRDVEKIIQLYPKLEINEIEDILNIGMGCGNCKHSEHSDHYFVSVQEIMEQNVYD